MKVFSWIQKDEKGQGMAEYGLILALVSVVAVGALGDVGGKVKATFRVVSNVDIQSRIDEGFIPISTAVELNAITNDKDAAEAVFGEGSDWEDTYTVEGLSGKYIQVSVIDLSEKDNFTPIGNEDEPFTGEFDGGNYTIKGLTINKPDVNHVGLFGYTQGSTIDNMSLENVNVIGKENVGGLVGYQIGSSIMSSSVKGKVHGERLVGGLVGRQLDSDTARCASSGEVTNVDFGGGLVGFQNNSTITNSHSSSRVEGSHYLGGLVGEQQRGSITENSYSTGDVVGNYHIGGLIGHQNDAIMKDSYATGDVSGDERGAVGGLVGSNYHGSVILNSYSKGDVFGSKWAGGLLGYNNSTSIVDKSYSAGSVEIVGGDAIESGAFIGLGGGTIRDSGWSLDNNQGMDGFGRPSGTFDNVKGQSLVEINKIINSLSK